MKRTCIIFNKAAGQASDLQRRLSRVVTDRDSELCAKREDESIEQQARRAIDEGFKRIVVAGGDGTLNRVVNGVAPCLERVELGVIPLGTGNDSARSLEIPVDNLDAAIDIAFGEATQAVDLLRVTDGKAFYAVNAASGGMAGKVASDVLDSDKARWGAFAYWMTAFSELIDMQASDLHLDIGDQSYDLRVYGVVIANGRFVGGGFPIAPAATPNDGKLTIVIIPILPTLELLSAGVNYALGRNPASGPIKVFETQRVHLTSNPEMLFSVDGEPTREIEATFEVIPKALRMAVGPSLRNLS